MNLSQTAFGIKTNRAKQGQEISTMPEHATHVLASLKSLDLFDLETTFGITLAISLVGEI